MLTELAFLKSDDAVSEVTRYLGWPGQAITYKVGERVIVELREQLRGRRGASFDLKGFHASVLGSGPVGLGHLRDLVLGGGPRSAAGSGQGRIGVHCVLPLSVNLEVEMGPRTQGIAAVAYGADHITRQHPTPLAEGLHVGAYV